MLLVEAEVIVFIGLGVIAHRIDLFIDLQQDILPAAVLVSLLTAGVFAWRARAWTKTRIEGLRDWGGPATSSYAEKIAARRTTPYQAHRLAREDRPRRRSPPASRLLPRRLRPR